MIPVGQFSLQHRMPPQAGPSASRAPASAPSPSRPARPIDDIRAEREACGQALAEAYARQGQAGQPRGSRPPAGGELPGAELQVRDLRSGPLATVTYRDAQTGRQRHWNLDRNAGDIARIAQQAERYACLEAELRAAQSPPSPAMVAGKRPRWAAGAPPSLESLPGELLEQILRNVPNTRESRVMSLAMASRTLKAKTFELARMKARVAWLKE